VRPTITPDVEAFYKEYANTFRQGVTKQMMDEKPAYLG